ncbi:hypothetical protein Lgor_0319 [Fluoribacter gormanii]|uniref:Uncharacterized protein n=1 Tax=Fluoribacter gormanii TaxID=464 RepID=A0A377GHE4_9GAMM|nr:hypothetical protein Lgor_0319 [Fluoribacter gormanii]SIR76694.1 hypothetical protein SAMN05421777_12352 [Fluoribacter gormanii]STO23965.1 Uncharacterised protein [Fluoribacter gormanii]
MKEFVAKIRCKSLLFAISKVYYLQLGSAKASKTRLVLRIHFSRIEKHTTIIYKFSPLLLYSQSVFKATTCS